MATVEREMLRRQVRQVLAHLLEQRLQQTEEGARRRRELQRDQQAAKKEPMCSFAVQQK